MNKKGFTLVELLTAIIITGVLVAMAVPMYEKSVEKSRMAEVRVRLSKLFDAKMRVMSEWNMKNYDTTLTAENLDVSFPCAGGATCTGTSFSTDHFKYTLQPTGNAPVSLRDGTGVSGAIGNTVCAVRRTGDNQGMALLYVGDLSNDATKRFFCHNGTSAKGCENIGMTPQMGSAWCSL